MNLGIKHKTPLYDPTGELQYMRDRIFLHVETLYLERDSRLRIVGDYIRLYIKELENELRKEIGNE